MREREKMIQVMDELCQTQFKLGHAMPVLSRQTDWFAETLNQLTFTTAHC